MSRRMTTSILVLLMLGLVSAVGQAAPQIKAAKPASVSLQQGRIVTVELQGNKLREAKSAVVYSLRSDQPVRGLSAKLGQGNNRKRKLTLKAGANVNPGTYRVMLTSRGKKVLVPLKFRVTARKTVQSKPKPKAPATIASSSPTPNNSLKIAAAKKQTRRVNKENPKIPGAISIPRSGEPDNPTLTQIQLYYYDNGQSSYEIAYDDTVRIFVTRGGGNPSHYRVSESAGFTGADWKVFRGYQPITVTFASDTPGEKTIYFQLMNGVGQSEVASDSITYEGPLVSQVHDLSGLLLSEFFELAQTNGYGFNAERLSGAGECLQSINTQPDVGGWYMQAEGELIPTLEVFGAPPQLEADSEAVLGRPISCQFRVLDGKMLREGWRIIDTSVFDSYAATNPCVGVNLLDLPSGIDRDPGYRIVITAYQGVGIFCGLEARRAFARILRIKLEGPSNEDWRMALQP